MESSRILVTGGAGFIGTNLVNELKSRDHMVTALDLYNTDRDAYLRADVRNYRQLERVFENDALDYVYHLAIEYGRWAFRHKPGFICDLHMKVQQKAKISASRILLSR